MRRIKERFGSLCRRAMHIWQQVYVFCAPPVLRLGFAWFRSAGPFRAAKRAINAARAFMCGCWKLAILVAAMLAGASMLLLFGLSSLQRQPREDIILYNKLVFGQRYDDSLAIGYGYYEYHIDTDYTKYLERIRKLVRQARLSNADEWLHVVEATDDQVLVSLAMYRRGTLLLEEARDSKDITLVKEAILLLQSSLILDYSYGNNSLGVDQETTVGKRKNLEYALRLLTQLEQEYGVSEGVDDEQDGNEDQGKPAPPRQP